MLTNLETKKQPENYLTEELDFSFRYKGQEEEEDNQNGNKNYQIK